MNTDIYFQVSVPATLSIFGEHTKNRLRASIDLRTTLTFQEVPASLSNFIEINFPQINLFCKIPLQEILNFYNYSVENMELLHEIVLQFPFEYESIYQKIFLQIFCYLIVLITYKEQIEIKSFIIVLTSQLISNGEFISLASLKLSLKVCLVACLLHWSRLQKGAHSTFDETDFENICNYTICCKNIALESDLIDIIVCTYGSIMKEKDQYMGEGFRLPSMTILLVDSNQTQDVEAQKQRVAELMNMFPEFANSILSNIDTVTNMGNNVFQKIFDICTDDKLSIEMKNDCFLQQHKALETCTRMNHRLLQMLGVSNIQLDEICAITQKYGLSGKCTDFDNGRYAYVWYPYTNKIDIMIFINELKTHGFDVIQTNVLCTGIKIE